MKSGLWFMKSGYGLFMVMVILQHRCRPGFRLMVSQLGTGTKSLGS